MFDVDCFRPFKCNSKCECPRCLKIQIINNGCGGGGGGGAGSTGSTGMTGMTGSTGSSSTGGTGQPAHKVKLELLVEVDKLVKQEEQVQRVELDRQEQQCARNECNYKCFYQCRHFLFSAGSTQTIVFQGVATADPSIPYAAGTFTLLTAGDIELLFI